MLIPAVRPSNCRRVSPALSQPAERHYFAPCQIRVIPAVTSSLFARNGRQYIIPSASPAPVLIDEYQPASHLASPSYLPSADKPTPTTPVLPGLLLIKFRSDFLAFQSING